MENSREYLVKSFLSKASTMAELCQECGVSRKTAYKWVKRYQEHGVEGLSDLSKANKDPHRKFSEDQIRKCVECKLRFKSQGPKKILVKLHTQFPDEKWPGATRLYEILKEHHLVSSRKLRRRVPRTQPLGDVNNSNDVWCADFKGWFKTADEAKVEPFTVTDGFSRFLIRCTHLERKRTMDVWKVLEEAFYEYGLPLRFRTDNGPPFATPGVGRLSQLSVNLIKAGVTPEWITPGHPEENGRHERFHRSLKEAIANPPADTFVKQLSLMRQYISEYNFDRPHEALGMSVPGSVYTPSSRIWNGKLCSPEYGESLTLRKVGPNGCIYVKGHFFYLGTVISGEHVGLQQIDDEYFRVFYGPVFLGTIVKGTTFEKPMDCYR